MDTLKHIYTYSISSFSLITDCTIQPHPSGDISPPLMITVTKKSVCAYIDEEISQINIKIKKTKLKQVTAKKTPNFT